jgi:geranylgeranyl pyrophosphate synthase
MIRARALLSCAMDGDGLINPDAIKAAAAVELLHLATLVHDDIIDDADKRRGIDALHKKFGEKYAVLCGDYLFSLAIDFVSSVTPPEKRVENPDLTLPHYLTEICLGELRQDQNSGNLSLSEREYFKIIRGKTAALFEASFYSGFLFSDEEDARGNLYREIGGNIGIIFQLADDLADYESTEFESKKPVLSDFSRGVVTLPLIYALKNDASLPGKIASGIEPAGLKNAIESAGGLEYTHNKITELHKKTKKVIISLDIPAIKKELLLRLLGLSSGIKA